MKMLQWISRAVCMLRGHDFGGVVYISPAILTHCHRCGEEIQGRTIDDLEPMTDEDYEHLEDLERMEAR